MVRPRAAVFRRGGLFFLVLLLTGCATTPQSERIRQTAAAFPAPVELASTPFFPQQQYQCGPAALATTLNAAGVAPTPDELTPLAYLPARQGSLQIELIAATRHYGRVPYVLRPQLESVLAEVAGGNPVLVLQNLGLSWWEQWHYAVVVGFDLANDVIVLRSGAEARHRLPLETFERTWSRGGHWAMVTLAPDRLPETAEETPYLTAVYAFESMKSWETAATAYATVLRRWPKNLAARIGLGNSRHALGDLAGAEAAFRRATIDHPDAAPAFNNLAQTLADRKKWKAARAAAARAVELGGPQTAVYRETLETIDRRTPANSAARSAAQ